MLKAATGERRRLLPTPPDPYEAQAQERSEYAFNAPAYCESKQCLFQSVETDRSLLLAAFSEREHGCVHCGLRTHQTDSYIPQRQQLFQESWR
jgi:hypothetical protein